MADPASDAVTVAVPLAVIVRDIVRDRVRAGECEGEVVATERKGLPVADAGLADDDGELLADGVLVLVSDKLRVDVPVRDIWRVRAHGNARVCEALCVGGCLQRSSSRAVSSDEPFPITFREYWHKRSTTLPTGAHQPCVKASLSSCSTQTE